MRHSDRVAKVERVEVQELVVVPDTGLSVVKVTANAFTFPVLGLEGCDTKEPSIACVLVNSDNILDIETRLKLCKTKAIRTGAMYYPTEENLVQCKMLSVLGISCVVGTTNNGYLIRIPETLGATIVGRAVCAAGGKDVLDNKNYLKSIVKVTIDYRVKEFERLCKLEGNLKELDSRTPRRKGETDYGYWLSKFYEGLEVGVMQAEEYTYEEIREAIDCVVLNDLDVREALTSSEIGSDFPYLDYIVTPNSMALEIYVDLEEPNLYGNIPSMDRANWEKLLKDMSTFEYGLKEESLMVRVITKVKYSDVKRSVYGLNPISLTPIKERELKGNPYIILEHVYMVKPSELGVLQSILHKGYGFEVDFELHGTSYEEVRFTTI